MKQLTKLMTRLRRRKPRRQDKHGSSMALVMIITSALVIWVMCLAPLMATTGTAALKVQNGYTDYLSSRSAIEYAKSELELIVRDEVPYTFAVIKQSNGTYTTYTAIPKAHKDGCVGMAANMIGVAKRIIAFDNEGTYMVMFNPEIIKTAQPYETEEGCLSLSGIRKTKRYRSIKVQYQNEDFAVRLKKFTGWTAQIIQHEIDHCNGILI